MFCSLFAYREEEETKETKERRLKPTRTKKGTIEDKRNKRSNNNTKTHEKTDDSVDVVRIKPNEDGVR